MKAGRPFPVVITDLGMPHVDGRTRRDVRRLDAPRCDGLYSRVQNTRGVKDVQPPFISRVCGSRYGGKFAGFLHRVRQPSHQDPARHPAVDREVRSRERPRRHAAQGIRGGFPRNRIRGLLRQDSGRPRQTHEGHRLQAGQHACRRGRHREERRRDHRATPRRWASNTSSAPRRWSRPRKTSFRGKSA